MAMKMAGTSPLTSDLFGFRSNARDWWPDENCLGDDAKAVVAPRPLRPWPLGPKPAWETRCAANAVPSAIRYLFEPVNLPRIMQIRPGSSAWAHGRALRMSVGFAIKSERSLDCTAEKLGLQPQKLLLCRHNVPHRAGQQHRLECLQRYP